MRIAITGASGNIGSALLRALQGSEHETVGVVRRPPVTTSPPFGRVSWHEVDLTDEAQVPRLREAVRGADAVVHLAWGFQPAHRFDYLEELGVGGTRRVTEAVAAESVPHLVHMSSIGAYSPRRDIVPVTEDYPTDGIQGSPYSRHKSAAEHLLNDFEVEHPEVTVTRLRPGIVGQRNAASALLRYAVPGLVPAKLLGMIPVLPLDRRVLVPMVHADDVADAIVRVLDQRAPGPFNLAAEPVITVEHIAAALNARHVHVPGKVVRAVAAGAWRARLEQVDPGWLDMAHNVPLLDSTRAEKELGWLPRRDAVSVLEEVVAGMLESAHDLTPPLRRRTISDNLRRAVGDGPVHRRAQP